MFAIHRGADADERARIRARADVVNQGTYATYQSRTTRRIPVIALEPR